MRQNEELPGQIMCISDLSFRKNTAHSHFYLAGDLLTAVFHPLNTVTQPQEHTYSEKGVKKLLDLTLKRS